MTARRRWCGPAAGAAFAVGLGALCGACRGEQPPPPTQGALAPSARPVDKAAPGELAEGDERAFGLPIPRKMSVSKRYPDAVFALGALKREDVANYVRARVIAESVETGPSKSVFTKATVKAAPDRMLRIEVVLRDTGTELLVRDETRPPTREGLSPEERMREVGLRPDGKPLDPKTMQ